LSTDAYNTVMDNISAGRNRRNLLRQQRKRRRQAVKAART
jgi:hypothetical protein